MNNHSYFSVKEMGKISIFAALTSILAYIIIPLPFSPVPVSGQTLGVMMAGLFLKPGAAVASQIVYIAMGIIGLPVFSGGRAGLGILFGPTGGYLWGFILGAYIIARLINYTDENDIYKNFLILFTGGLLIIHLLGLIQYTIITDVSIKQAFITSLLPFIPGDIFKIILVLFLNNKLKKN